MKIALLHYRAGENDGVSLEMKKWRSILERMGHEVTYIAGSLGKEEGYEVPNIMYDNPRNKRILNNSFMELEEFKPAGLIEEIKRYSREINRSLIPIIGRENIDCIIGNNIWSLGCNLSLPLALKSLDGKKPLLVGHHHDFYWERSFYSNPTTNYVRNLLEDNFPPTELDGHVVINTIAQEVLKTKKDIDSVVIPNVFDFSDAEWNKDSFNNDLKKKLGIEKGDIVFLQATRIVERKAIELVLHVLKVFTEECFPYLVGSKNPSGETINRRSRVHLVLPGFAEKDSSEYQQKLEALTKLMPFTTHFVKNLCLQERSFTEKEKKYSLWDFYTIADFTTYPSILEGWGNQFLESVFAKKPVIVFEYPVLRKDILPKGFDVISLGDSFTVNKFLDIYQVEHKKARKVAEKCMDLIRDPEQYRGMVEKNFKIGKENYSYENLQDMLKKLFTSVSWTE
ncbi:MAG: glycosyltransferase family 4 protein [Kosmotogaceae bacterium]